MKASIAYRSDKKRYVNSAEVAFFLLLQIFACDTSSPPQAVEEAMEIPCFDDIVPFPQTAAEHRKVLQLHFQYGADFHDLILKDLHIGYGFGPNHFNTEAGYLYQFEDPSGEIIEEFTDEVPIRKFVEEVGCVMQEPDEVAFFISTEFTDANIHQARVTDMGVEIQCGGSSYQGSGEELMLIPLSICQETLCQNPLSEDDPWCE